MSLKGFHILFIICSIVIVLFFGFWSLNFGGSSGYFFAAMVSIFSAVGLFVYLMNVIGKLNELGNGESNV